MSGREEKRPELEAVREGVDDAHPECVPDVDIVLSSDSDLGCSCCCCCCMSCWNDT